MIRTLFLPDRLSNSAYHDSCPMLIEKLFLAHTPALDLRIVCVRLKSRPKFAAEHLARLLPSDGFASSHGPLRDLVRAQSCVLNDPFARDKVDLTRETEKSITRFPRQSRSTIASERQFRVEDVRPGELSSPIVIVDRCFTVDNLNNCQFIDASHFGVR